VATKACNLLGSKNVIKAVMLPWKPELVYPVGKKRLISIAGFIYTEYMDIF
jgi:hypothetical protein